MRTVLLSCITVFLMASSACRTLDSSFQNEYRPSCTGSLSDGENGGNIQLTLQSARANMQRGVDVMLAMSIRNVGDAPVVFTQSPEAHLTWIYPDGRRDHLLGEVTELSGLSGLRLEPGQEVVRTPVVKTSSFNRTGITEFRAILTSTSVDGRGWTGKAVSNGWGVLIE